ncbi:MAG: UDP-N-acetylmuramoyl-L-alanine--D-glutamate ligase [Minisyncoccia bacterium]|jgi:UDP-N-acetylmuramoylalanine--D-glutamate ligase
MSNLLKNNKVLLIGLGILGGGVNTAKWLLKQGAKLTITDLKDRKELASSLKALEAYAGEIKYTLGRHDKSDILENEIIVLNPDVPLSSPFVKLAKDLNKRIENELTLFCQSAPTKDIIAVTGTRGKTTTANWIGHLLRAKYPTAKVIGNSPDNPLLNASGKIGADAPVVVETPSFLLEHVAGSAFKPKVAIFTNIYPDHLNRYDNIEHYARIKANIFSNQTAEDVLILGCEKKWRQFLRGLKPLSHVIYPPAVSDISKYVRPEAFVKKWGEHNLTNLRIAIAAAKSFGLSDGLIKKAIATLPQIKFRQELVYDKRGLEIYNDTCATSPEAAVAAVERFGGNGKNLVLITGGTDRKLKFKPLAGVIKRKIKKGNLVLLEGSATAKIAEELKNGGLKTTPTLKLCFQQAMAIVQTTGDPSIILFSPGSKSFEKFRNEYDRGEQFNKLVRDSLK